MTLLDAGAATVSPQRHTVRELLEAVQDLDAPRQRARLLEMTDDAQTVAIVEDLLRHGARTRRLSGAPACDADHRDTELDAGDLLGPWRLVERIASGGMGTVFVAERADDLYTQRVAIKLLRGTPDPATAQRMAVERQVLAQLQHPRIARLYDGGTTPGGQPYLVMEYVDGVALDRYCRERAPGLEARIALFLRICQAVEAAHQQLVVHCDLKPGNVMVLDNGEPMLLDFGIARALGAGGEATADFCTPAYASPELLEGGRIGTASDVFSLGVLLAELLAGQRPPRDPQAPATPVPWPSAVARADVVAWHRALRGDLDAIVAKACAIDPAERYATVGALADDLQRHARHLPVRARNAGAAYRLRRLLRRRWREAAVSGVVLALCGGFVWGVVDQRQRAERAAATSEKVSELLVAAFEAADPKRRAGREPTAREVLDAGAAKLSATAVGDPEVLARLQEKLGGAYHNLGLPERAEPLMLAAIDGYLGPSVQRPLDAARVLSDLAVMRSNGKSGPAAIAAARRALALRKSAGGSPLEIADSLNTLGIVLVDEDNAEAEAVLVQALALRRRHLGEPSAEVGTVLHNLGRLQRHRGEYAAAETFYREALTQKEAVDGTANGSYLFSLSGLAMAVREQGRLREAAALQGRILELSKVLYRDGTNLGDAHNELANTLHDLGEWPQALPHYMESLRLTGQGAGVDSVSYAVSLNNQSSLEEDRGALARAEQGFRRSLAIREATQPADSVTVLTAQFNLGRVLLRAGKVDDAGRVIVPAWTRWSARHPKDHPKTLGFATVRAEWLIASGQWPAARSTLAALWADAGEASARRRAALHELRAQLALHRGDGQAATAERRASVDAMARDLGADHVETAKHRVALAEALRFVGDAAAARVELARAVAVLGPRLYAEAPLQTRMRMLDAALGGGRVARVD